MLAFEAADYAISCAGVTIKTHRGNENVFAPPALYVFAVRLAEVAGITR